MGQLTGTVTSGDPECLVSKVTLGVSTGQRIKLDALRSPLPADIANVRGHWDTGAEVAVVDLSYVKSLGLDQVGYRGVRVGGGVKYTATYAVNVKIDFDDGASIVVEDAECIGDKDLRKSVPYGVLLGRPVLDKLIFVYHGQNLCFTVWDSWPT